MNANPSRTSVPGVVRRPGATLAALVAAADAAALGAGRLPARRVWFVVGDGTRTVDGDALTALWAYLNRSSSRTAQAASSGEDRK